MKAIASSLQLSRFKTSLSSLTKLVAACGIAAMFICDAASGMGQAVYVGAQTVLASGYGGPAGVAVDSAGNVYVSEYDGGTIDEIQAVNGVISASSPIRQLTQCSVDCEGIAVDRNSNVYFVDYSSVKEMLAVNGVIPPTPTIRTLSSAFTLPEAVAVDGSGDVFVADLYTGVVSEIVAVNGSIPASPTVTPVASGFNGAQGLAFDRSGNLYVADYSVKEILAVNGSIPSSPTVITVPGGTGGNRGVAIDNSGNVYFSDESDETVKEILAVNGSIPASPTVITLINQGLDAVDGVAVDGRGNVFMANIGISQVIEVSPTGNFGLVNAGATSAATALRVVFGAPTTLGSTAVLTQGMSGLDFADAGTGTCVTNYAYMAGQTCTINVTFTPKFSGTRYGVATLQDGNGNTIAQAYLVGTGVAPQLSFTPGKQTPMGSGFYQPWAAASDASGNIFVADHSTYYVEEIVAVNGVIPPSPTIKTLGSAQTYPAGIAVDGNGNLYVASFSQNAVYELTKSSGYSSIISLGGGFYIPSDVAVDGYGNVIVADYGNNAVKKIPPGCVSSACVVTLGSGFQSPFSVALDGNSNIFVADTNNFAIKEILASSGYATTQTILSNIHSPFGLAVDAAGDVYFSDYGTNTVKELMASNGYTTSTTIAGGFNGPHQLALSPNGNLLVADTGNNQIVQIDVVDPPTFNFAPTPLGTTSADSPQTVTLGNIGNAALTLPIPATGSNPSISTNFSLSSTGTSACPLVTSTSYDPGMLASGASCTLPISFNPTVGGAQTGYLALTDNNLNAAGPAYATQNITLNGVGQTTPIVTWPAPTAITYSTPLGSAQLNATASVPGTFVYSPAAGTVLAAGSQILSVTFTPTDSTDYTTSKATVALTVNKAVTVITWPTPAPIAYGTPLGATQLDATANVPGTFSYSPSQGSILPVGKDTLNVSFTPSDTSDYSSAASSVVLTVNAVPGFSLSASPASLSIKPGGSATSTISVNAVGGFNGSVTLTVSSLPSGVSASFSPNPATKSSVLTFNVTGKASAGTSAIVVTGKSGSMTQTTSIALSITSKK